MDINIDRIIFFQSKIMSNPKISTIEDLELFIDGYNDFPYEDKLKNIHLFANIMSDCQVSLKHNNITCSKSNIHGIGVFATKNIPKNKIVTFYPGNAVICYENDEEKSQYICSDNDNFLENFEYYKEYYTFAGSCKLFGDYGLIGDPNIKNNSLYMGHLLNDGIGNLFHNISYNNIHKDPEISRNIFKQYKNQIGKINCDLELLDDLPIAFIVSKNNINKGDELLTFYDIPYWYGTEYPNCKNIYDDLKKLKEFSK